MLSAKLSPKMQPFSLTAEFTLRKYLKSIFLYIKRRLLKKEIAFSKGVLCNEWRSCFLLLLGQVKNIQILWHYDCQLPFSTLIKRGSHFGDRILVIGSIL